MRTLLLLCLSLAVASVRAAQTSPTFDVASVKLNTSGDPRTSGRLAGATFAMTNETLWTKRG